VEGPGCRAVIRRERLAICWDQVTLPRALKREGIDVFLTPYFKAPLRPPCPMAVIINDLIPLLYPQYGRREGRLKRLYFRILAGQAVRRSDALMTISAHAQSDIARTFGLAREHITVIPLAVDRRFHPRREGLESLRSRYGLPERFICYAGNFHPHKNLSGLVRAYAGLPEEIRRDHGLVIGGKGNRHREELEQLVAALGVRGQVVLTGFLPDDDLVRLYNAARLFVFPSFYEGFGLPPLEAMACGTPVICSNAASLPEVVGEGALLVDPHDTEALKATIERVLCDSALRRRMAEKGRARAGLFTPDRTTDTLLEVLVRAAAAA
jgi:glycosyltransferase involved in cell wall biosynthesis